MMTQATETSEATLPRHSCCVLARSAAANFLMRRSDGGGCAARAVCKPPRSSDGREVVTTELERFESSHSSGGERVSRSPNR